MIEIRKATEADKDLLTSFYMNEVEEHPQRASAFAESLIMKFRTLLAIQNGEIRGSLSWEPRGGYDDGVIELASLGIHQSFRRQGIGTLLVSRMIEDATQFYMAQGYQLRTIILFMEAGNEGAKKFYSAICFSEAARIPHLYPHDDALIWMRHLKR